MTLQECEDTCEVTNDFLGFAHGYGSYAFSTSCHCYYDDGGLPADTPSGFSRNDGNVGTGPVDGSLTPNCITAVVVTSEKCFKYHPAFNTTKK